jgi:hypothetical protein
MLLILALNANGYKYFDNYTDMKGGVDSAGN